MRILYFLISTYLIPVGFVRAQNFQVLDSASREPVPFVTLAFGNGLGTFANGDGVFRFSAKLYPTVDSLTISSLGYKSRVIATADLASPVVIVQETSELETVIINAEVLGDFSTDEIKAIAHKEYENCWLPTVESEIAVKFERVEGKKSQITHLLLPILLETNAGRKGGSRRKFSTMFRVMFYDVAEDGLPDPVSQYPSKTFVIDDKSASIYKLDLVDMNVMIPVNGLYASIQVLGYTTPDGELINSKKYREFKTVRGVKKVSNTYRPLLPFTTEDRLTYVRRVFHNEKQWQELDLQYNQLSKLVRSGHTHYGMGAELRVYD